MKDIHAILSEIGFTVPEDKKAAFDSAVKENYRTADEVGKIIAARDDFESRLKIAQDALEDFKGVDVKELQGKITTLTNDLATKDREYQDKIADMEFISDLDSAMTSAKAKNTKAVKALLDIDTLKASKNRADDIKKALDEVKKDNDYLFESDEPVKNPVKDTGNTHITGGMADIMRASMGLKNKS